MEEIKLNNRKAVYLYQDDSSLTFIKPLSAYYNDHLIVIYEDAYGDAVSGVMHKKTINENYQLSIEVIDEIFEKLNK